MIRIVRGLEPAALPKARRKRLGAAAGAVLAGNPITFAGYGAAKSALHAAQRKKCAYCERHTDYAGSPTEHFRPKDGAKRTASGVLGKVDVEHYWWLAWTWENLFLACVRCNLQGHKGNQFPLVAGTRACYRPARSLLAAAAAIPPANASRAAKKSLRATSDAALDKLAVLGLAKESPALVDPAVDDPLDHLEWKPVDRTQPREQWTWDVSPKGGSAKGAETIATLKLRELCEDVAIHFADAVLPSIEEVDQHLAAGRAPEAMARWTKLVARALAPEAKLSAATWYALVEWMPAALRTQHGLSHPPRP